MFMSRFNTFQGSDNPYYKIRIPTNLRRCWQLIEFFSVVPIVLSKFILPSLLNYRVIAERYTPDFIIWVSITTNDKYYSEKIEARFLMALSYKACIRIYVTAALEELLKRRKEDSDSLCRQIELYEKIASTLDAFRLDTTHSNSNESLKKILSLKSMQQFELVND